MFSLINQYGVTGDSDPVPILGILIIPPLRAEIFFNPG